MSRLLREYERGLRLIAEDGCDRLTSGWCGEQDHWSPYARYMEGRWCLSCVARATLAGELPRRPVVIEAEGNSLVPVAKTG